MKKSIFVLFSLVAFVTINAQSLEEIVKKQAQALGEEKYDKVTSLKITGKMSQMGMDLIMNLYYKAPNKSKNVISVNGMEIIQLFDGEKGYMINPMTGSSDPQEMPVDQVQSLKNNSTFKSPLTQYLKDGKLVLEGTENVKDKPAFKIKINDPVATTYMYVDKSSYLPVKTSVTSNGVTVDSFQEWGDLNGLMLPKVTTTSANGMEFVLLLENVEINIPLEDSFFKVK